MSEENTKPLSDDEISLIELHVNGKMEREYPEHAALVRGCLITIHDLKAEVASWESFSELCSKSAATALKRAEVAEDKLKIREGTFVDE